MKPPLIYQTEAMIYLHVIAVSGITKCDSICISHACVALLPARAKYAEHKP